MHVHASHSTHTTFYQGHLINTSHTFFWRAMYSSADIEGPEDVFLWADNTGEAAAAGDLLGGLSNAGSGILAVLVFGVTDLEEGGDGLLPTFSKEPLEPKDWKIGRQLILIISNACLYKNNESFISTKGVNVLTQTCSSNYAKKLTFYTFQVKICKLKFLESWLE